MKNQHKYYVTPSQAKIATLRVNHDYGDFITGITNENESFNYQHLWWLLLPFLGWAIVAGVIIHYLFCRRPTWYVLVYRHGIVIQDNSNKNGNIPPQGIDFRELKGLRCCRKRRYKSTYGNTTYLGTDVMIDAIDHSGNHQHIFSGEYDNEHDDPGKYEAIELAVKAISDSWDPIAIDLFNKEFEKHGYGTFECGSCKIHVGPGFIGIDGDVISEGNLRYDHNDDLLTISSPSGSLTINLSDIYNEQTFYMAISQYLGINL